MTGMKTLYAGTLLLSAAPGFSTGWTARPAEVVMPVSLEERLLVDYERAYRISPAEKETLRAILRDFTVELEALRTELDRKYGDQVDAVKDKYDARIRAVLTPEKKR